MGPMIFQLIEGKRFLRKTKNGITWAGIARR
jgi:hypothetical protein